MHDSHIPNEFSEKISEANQLYREAFLSFLPENAKGHLMTIQSELSALCKECFVQAAFTSGNFASSAGTNNTVPSDSHRTQKVKKVMID